MPCTCVDLVAIVKTVRMMDTFLQVAIKYAYVSKGNQEAIQDFYRRMVRNLLARTQQAVFNQAFFFHKYRSSPRRAGGSVDFLVARRLSCSNGSFRKSNT